MMIASTSLLDDMATTVKNAWSLLWTRNGSSRSRESDPNVEVRYKEESSFRIERIEVKKYEAIDQIKIIYDDDTEWTCGHDDGDKDARSLIMSRGEYLIRVTHETLENHEKAGAMVEFETNKGRVFLYKPSEFESVSIGEKRDLTTIWARDGYEIVSMKIRQGKLVGAEQQTVPEDELVEHPKHWYVLAYFDDDDEAYKDEKDKDEEGKDEEDKDEEDKDEKDKDEEGKDEEDKDEEDKDEEDKDEEDKDEEGKDEEDKDEEDKDEEEEEERSENGGSQCKDADTETLHICEEVPDGGTQLIKSKTQNEYEPKSDGTSLRKRHNRRTVGGTLEEESSKNNPAETILRQRTSSSGETVGLNNNNTTSSITQTKETNMVSSDGDESKDISIVDTLDENDAESCKSKVSKITSNGDESEDISSDAKETELKEPKKQTNYEDDFITYTHFDSKKDALAAWSETKHDIQQKQDRSGLLIDCIQSTVIHTAGSIASIERCREKAILRGLCVAMDDENPPLIELAYTLYNCLGSKLELFLFSVTFALTFFNFSVAVELSLLEGQLLAGLVTRQDTTDWRKRNVFEQLLCRLFVDCSNSYLSLCQTLIMAYILGTILQELVNIVYIHLRSILSDTKTAKLGKEMFIHILSMDKSFFDVNLSYGNGMNAGALHDLVFDTIPSILTSSIRFLVISYNLIKIDARLGMFCVGFITFYNMFVTNYFIRLEIQRVKKQRRLDIIQSKLSSDTFSMIKTIKFFAKEKFHITEYKDWFVKFIVDMQTGNGLYYLRSLFDESTHLIVFCGILYYGHMTKDAEQVGIGDFTGFVILYQQLKGLYGDVRDMIVYVGREYCDVQRYNALRDSRPKMANGFKKPDDIIGDIEFKNVHFQYPSRPKDKVLKGLNLSIKSNSMTAIVGESGAGKSTLAMLMTRLYDPTSGLITIDGHDMKTLDVEYLRSNIAIVDQNPQLFNRPLADNIAYGMAGDGECTDEMLEKAGKIANCDFIDKFREGYYTFAGYGGSELSGGQLQRIAIARAAIRNPKILILDEATSSLDAENEKEVQSALENLMKGRTVIVIAHRLSTIRNADTVICMKEGAVREQGTHDELMKLKGVYQNLVSKQIMENKTSDSKEDVIKSGEIKDDSETPLPFNEDNRTRPIPIDEGVKTLSIDEDGGTLPIDKDNETLIPLIEKDEKTLQIDEVDKTLLPIDEDVGTLLSIDKKIVDIIERDTKSHSKIKDDNERESV